MSNFVRVVAALLIASCASEPSQKDPDSGNGCVDCPDAGADLRASDDGGAVTYTCADIDFRVTGEECPATGCPAFSCPCASPAFPISITSCEADGCLVAADCEVLCNEGLERGLDCSSTYSIGIDEPDVEPTDYEAFCAAQTQVPEAECLALARYDEAFPNIGWFEGSDVCSFSQLECEDGSVARIFTNATLEGPVPDIFDDLPNLRWFSVRGAITALPPSLYRRTSLRVLQIDEAALDAPIPAEVGGLTALESLQFTNCGLTGGVPDTLGNLTALTNLDLQDNALTGPLPDLAGLGGLERLTLANNMLTGALPASLGGLAALETIVLTNNGFDGAVPDLSGLTRLETFSAARNGFTDISGAFAGLPALRVLMLADNELLSLPDDLGQLTSLTVLNVANNAITALPTSLGNLTSLNTLDVSGNALVAVPQPVVQLPALEHAILGGNALAGAVPDFASTMLATYRLEQNQLTGGLPGTIVSKPTLRTLWIHDNQMSGTLPAALANSAIDNFRARSNGCFEAPNAATAAWLDAADPQWACGCTMTCP